MHSVLVLMSTYNGEKFLKEQLESLYNQNGVDIHILVRDDGSSDSTIEILKEYSSAKGNLEIIYGDNVGAAKSFFEVALYAKENLPHYDYYAFCDQDDVWLPDKLISAVNSLEKTGENKLYFCRENYVDSNLNIIGTPKTIHFFDYTTSVYRNPALGCTMVFDKCLFDKFCLATTISDRINSLHDAWMFMCAMFTGANIISDNSIHLLYRQHGKNVTLAKKNTIQRYWTALKRKCKRGKTYRQDRATFYNLYLNHIDNQDKKDFYKSLISYDCSFKDTIKYLKKQKWKSEPLIDRVLWTFLVIFRLF